MKHYAIDQWADFSRGILVGEDSTAMQGHLNGGCTRCRQLWEFTSKLNETCARLGTTEVPESTVRLARAIFPVSAPERPTRGSRLPVELIFDSFLTPAPVGLRASWQAGWQGLYRSGDCSVDLRIEPELKSSRAALIGQITNHVAPETRMENVPVALKAGRAVVAETISNRFGEFQLEYDQQARLKLCIELRDSESIQVPLRRLTSETTAGQLRGSPRKRTPVKQ
jgi:hypothetical protein